MAEYALLLAANGGHAFGQVLQGVADDPILLWGGGAAFLLILVWVLAPNR